MPRFENPQVLGVGDRATAERAFGTPDRSAIAELQRTPTPSVLAEITALSRTADRPQFDERRLRTPDDITRLLTTAEQHL